MINLAENYLGISSLTLTKKQINSCLIQWCPISEKFKLLCLFLISVSASDEIID